MRTGAFIPSMFHRRLLLLIAMVAIGMGALAGQLAWLTVARHDELLAQAESRLVTHRWTPTVRGRVLDRKGRALAVDRPSFEVAVDYRVLTGAWAYSQAARQARRENAEEWPRLGREGREELIQRCLPAFNEQVEVMWSAVADATGVDEEELGARRNAVIERVEKMAATIWANRLDAERKLLRDKETSVELSDVVRPLREQRERHVIVRDVDDRAAFRLRSLGDALPGLEVRDAGQRGYPYETMDVDLDLSTLPSGLRRDGAASVRVEGVATHILGWMRQGVTREDIERREKAHPGARNRDRGHYQEEDSVGVAGVEASQEDRLRGLRGRIVHHLDTDEREITEPTPGEDVTLTIDIALQARVQAILGPAFGLTRVQEWHDNRDLPLGTTLLGAAVVIEIDTGDVLAMATSPSFTRAQMQDDPGSVFPRELSEAERAARRAQPWLETHTWLNRALSAPYQPGSIVKPLILVEAVTRGAHALDRPIECTGHFLADRQDVMRCWIYRQRFGLTTHTAQTGGPLGAAEAIARSCNIYFYTLGRALGPSGIEHVYRRHGVGRPYDVGLPNSDGAGFLGALGSSEPLSPSDAIFMGIGQGPVSWTPLHAADAYATLARGGVRIEPRVVASLERRPDDLGLHRRAIDQALEGLRLGVTAPYGTGHHIMVNGRQEEIFNARGVRVVGKTGTAQAVRKVGIATAGGEATDFHEHAWTVVLVGPEKGPLTHAVSVVIELAGSGGKVAGPVCNQVIHALQSEGYLPGGAS